MSQTSSQSLGMMLRQLRLPSFVTHHTEIAQQAEQQGWTLTHYLQHLAEMELEDRDQRRTRRLLKKSRLPMDKTIDTLEMERLPALCEGGFVERAENVLCFGLPGRGKTHLVCAIGHELIHRGYSQQTTPRQLTGS